MARLSSYRPTSMNMHHASTIPILISLSLNFNKNSGSKKNEKI